MKLANQSDLERLLTMAADRGAAGVSIKCAPDGELIEFSVALRPPLSTATTVLPQRRTVPDDDAEQPKRKGPPAGLGYGFDMNVQGARRGQ